MRPYSRPFYQRGAFLHEALKRRLEAFGTMPIHCHSVFEGTIEASWYVEGASIDSIHALGIEFNQDSILEADQSTAIVVPCLSGNQSLTLSLIECRFIDSHESIEGDHSILELPQGRLLVRYGVRP